MATPKYVETYEDFVNWLAHTYAEARKSQKEAERNEIPLNAEAYLKMITQPDEKRV